MTRFFKVSSYLLLVFNILLLFLLFFEEKVNIPLWLTPFGRIHPMLLHLPIGFSVALMVFLLLKSEFETKSYETLIRLIIILTALSAAISALMGFFLSKEGGYDARILQWHKWTGVGVSLFTYGLVWFNDNLAQKTKAFKALSLGSLLLIILAGHFGAAITHGENYVFEVFQKKKTIPAFSENTSVYEAAIFPILETKCIACHNDQKVKGELNMSSIEKILKGGKNGSLWKAGDTLNSHLLQRVNLPLEEKKHMPPKGKTQLTIHEIALLTAWINEGADMKKAFKDYKPTSTTKILALQLANNQQEEQKAYTFPMASESTIEEVNTPFCSVFPLATGSPALQAEFFVSKKFDRKVLENLSKVKDQLVSLNLAKMPVKDEDISLIAKFPNLEKLNLNQTDITGITLDQLAQCKNLKSVALAGTKITKDKFQKLMTLPSLAEVFVWNTPLDSVAIKELSAKYPKVLINNGSKANTDEILKLNTPTLVNEEFILKANTPIEFKHTLKNVAIHYTLDGTDPDSTTKTLYEKPIVIDNYTRIKAIATKEGWYASNRIAYTFFKSTFSPDTAILLTPPNAKYLGKGGKTLIDLKKGSSDNFNDPTWVGYGYQDTDFETQFEFRNAIPLRTITISYLLKINSFIMPPTEVEVWGGNTPADLKRLQKIIPEQPTKMEGKSNPGLNIFIKSGNYKIIKIIAKPLKKLPKWHKDKGKPAWFFVDEILFN